MFKGFELTLNETEFLPSYGEYSKSLGARCNEIVNKFNEVLLSDGKIDADKIIEEWFPVGQYHVFISHSHKDSALAEQLANWLYDEFELTSFLDSHIWGYANNLLKELNEKYAKNGEDTYAYGPAISNAAHVYLMLSTALTEAIDKSDCLFFLNTENTLENMKIEGSQEESRTASPWIMHELKTSAMLRRHSTVDRQKAIVEAVTREGIEKYAEFSFPVSTEHLLKIDEKSLLRWVEKCEVKNQFSNRNRLFSLSLLSDNKKKEFDALDVLYDLSLIVEGK